MAFQITPQSILHDTDLTSVEHQLDQCALKLGLLGEVDLARRMIELLHSAHLLGRRPANSLLAFAWHQTNHWPRTGPESEENRDEALSSLRKDYDAYWGGVPEDKRTYDSVGLRACLTYDDTERDPTRTINKSQRLVKALQISLEPNHTLSASSKPLRLSTFDAQTTDILKQNTALWDREVHREYLAGPEKLWPYYIRGLLASAMGIDTEVLHEEAKAILRVFKERLENGPVRSHLASKTMEELLRIGDLNTCQGPNAEGYWAENDVQDRPRTLFHKGASEEEIQALETRLGVVLPKDYKEFLSISNGFGDGNEHGIFNGYFPDPALFPIDEVKWCSEEYFQVPVELVDLPHELLDLLDPSTAISEYDGLGGKLPVFDRVLEIGNADIDNLWLVHPGLVAEYKEKYRTMYERANEKQRAALERGMISFAGNAEAFNDADWCFMKCSSGGAASMVPSLSFRRYLEELVDDSENVSH